MEIVFFFGKKRVYCLNYLYEKRENSMSDSKVFRIFVVNPGSTSTKVEFFENEKSVLEGNVFHDSAILKNFPTINDQLDYRMEYVKKSISI